MDSGLGEKVNSPSSALGDDFICSVDTDEKSEKNMLLLAGPIRSRTSLRGTIVPVMLATVMGTLSIPTLSTDFLSLRPNPRGKRRDG